MSARDSWGHEMESVFLYRVVAEVESSEERRTLFRKLAREAEAQAAIWTEEIRKTGGLAPEAYVPDARARIVAALVRRFGPRRMKGILAAMKVRGMSVYSTTAHAHANGHPMPRSVEDIGRRHRGGIAGGNLRAAVFGASDGLVSNVCLILGVAGAAGGGRTVLVSGVAGLLAGAFSMAAGEYVSVRSQREMFEHQIGAERDELAKYPHEEAAELSLIYQARGLGKDDADRMSTRIVANPGYALDTLAREELGLDPGRARLARRRGGVLVRRVRGGRGRAAGAVRARGRRRGARCGDRADRGRAVRRRLRDQPVLGAGRRERRAAVAADRRRRRRRHVRHRPPARRCGRLSARAHASAVRSPLPLGEG